ncbi:MAG: TetR/AcrR family transcriptional regulator [Bacteroidales bacterium]|nr:TetR/AcrR family transcriptional regulator [Bacteroidales bacterium]
MIEKETILEEVAKMFNTNGIRLVTMDSISMDLKISKRTLYEIFKDKDDLVTQVMQHELQKANEKIKKIIAESDNVLDAIFQIAEHKVQNNPTSKTNPKTIEDLKKYHPAIYSNAYEKIVEETYSTFFKLIERGKIENYFKKEVDSEILIYVTQKIVQACENDQEFIRSKPPVAFHNTLTIPLLIGISTPQGQEIINEKIKKLIKNKDNK